LERIRDPHHAIAYSMGGEVAAHENGRAASPDTGLDHIAGHVLRNHPIEKVMDVVEPLAADHRVIDLRDIAEVDFARRAVGLGVAPFESHLSFGATAAKLLDDSATML